MRRTGKAKRFFAFPVLFCYYELIPKYTGTPCKHWVKTIIITVAIRRNRCFFL